MVYCAKPPQKQYMVGIYPPRHRRHLTLMSRKVCPYFCAERTEWSCDCINLRQQSNAHEDTITHNRALMHQGVRTNRTHHWREFRVGVKQCFDAFICVCCRIFGSCSAYCLSVTRQIFAAVRTQIPLVHTCGIDRIEMSFITLMHILLYFRWIFRGS